MKGIKKTFEEKSYKLNYNLQRDIREIIDKIYTEYNSICGDTLNLEIALIIDNFNIEISRLIKEYEKLIDKKKK